MGCGCGVGFSSHSSLGASRKVHKMGALELLLSWNAWGQDDELRSLYFSRRWKNWSMTYTHSLTPSFIVLKSDIMNLLCPQEMWHSQMQLRFSLGFFRHQPIIIQTN